ncbi:hypothetical protein Ddye_000144 [Dipteronia dyeriana]|uniref:MULE transposase domain-containing protein n=1 Tax=Dipteronia dyeriana TaxID=168575 RepID=A0AAE0CS34_9ROSI|nr:hypothetical protein Ddye_000144 [Dipteronia dyeriana]
MFLDVSYDCLVKLVEDVAKVNVARYNLQLWSLVFTISGIAHPRIENDNDMSCMMNVDKLLPEVFVSVSAKETTDCVQYDNLFNLPTSEPVYGGFFRQLGRCGSIPIVELSICNNETIEDKENNKWLNTDNSDDSSIPNVDKAPKLQVHGHSLKPKDIMVEMQVEHGLHLLYSKAWRVKDHAEASVFGPPEESFKQLPAYCHRLEEVNPETITALKKNVTNQFEYMSIAHAASLHGFCTVNRLVIAINGTQLKGNCFGIMFVAIYLDANNQVFPLAYGFGNVEDEMSWTWFLNELKNVIGSPED